MTVSCCYAVQCPLIYWWSCSNNAAISRGSTRVRNKTSPASVAAARIASSIHSGHCTAAVSADRCRWCAECVVCNSEYSGRVSLWYRVNENFFQKSEKAECFLRPFFLLNTNPVSKMACDMVLGQFFCHFPTSRQKIMKFTTKSWTYDLLWLVICLFICFRGKGIDFCSDWVCLVWFDIVEMIFAVFQVLKWPKVAYFQLTPK